MERNIKKMLNFYQMKNGTFTNDMNMISDRSASGINSDLLGIQCM